MKIWQTHKWGLNKKETKKETKQRRILIMFTFKAANRTYHVLGNLNEMWICNLNLPKAYQT